MVTTKQQQQLDLADRIEKVQALIDELSREIDSIKANSPIAPPACGIVRFRAKGKGGAYWYYKWQSPNPIFVTKRGNSSRYKYIGKAGSPAFLEAVCRGAEPGGRIVRSRPASAGGAGWVSVVWGA